MKRCKSGQVFLLGTVLFIFVIMGLGTFTNHVIGDQDNYDFESLSLNIKNEMVKTREYEIRTGSEKMNNFTNMTTQWLRRSYPGADFIFIWGDTTTVNVVNYSSGTITKDLNTPYTRDIVLQLNGEDYVARFYPSTQVYFAIKKEDGNEVFVGFA